MIISMNVAGFNTYTDLGLVMTVEEMTPPAVKVYKVDVPMGNGCINLTSALGGDTVYENRGMTFVLTLKDEGADLEEMKTTVSNMLHGREHDFSLSFDEGYTYHGWFSVEAYEREGNKKQITLKVDADPYKKRKPVSMTFNAAGGVIAKLPSGRMRVRPVVTANSSCEAIFDENSVTLQAGSWVLNEFFLEQGMNELYLSTRDVSYLSWGDVEDNNITWGAFEKKHIFEWCKSPLSTDFEPLGHNQSDMVTINYEWGDL